MNLSDRRRGHRVKPDQRPGRHDDLSAVLPGKLDQVFVFEQRAGAQHDRGFSACHEGRNDRPHELRRRALDHDIGDIGEPFDRQDGGRRCQRAEPVAMLLGVLRRHRGENQSVYSPVQRLRNLLADRPQPGNRHPQVCACAFR